MIFARKFLPSSLVLCLCLSALVRATAGISPEELGALREKAEGGDAIAQHNVGLKYADAKDAFYNPIEAYAWLKISSLNGATGGGLDELKAQLTASQIADGDRRVEEIQNAQAHAARGPVSDGLVGPGEGPAAPSDLKKYSEELAAAWKENDQLKSELSTLRAAAANFEGERNGLLQKLASTSNSSATQAQVDAANAKAKAAADDLAAAQAAAASAASQAKKADELAVQVQQLSVANSELKAALEKASAVKPASAVQGQLDDAQVKLESALRSYDLAQKEVDRLQKALSAADYEKAELGSQVAALKTSASVSPAAPAASAAPAEVPASERSALEDTQMKLDAALRSFQLKQDEIDGLQKALSDLQSEKSTLTEKNQNLASQLAQAQADAASNRTAAAQLDVVREQLRHTQNQLVSVTTERVQARDRQSAAPLPNSGSLLGAPLRPQSVALAAPTPTPLPTPAVRTYTVVEGDTLSRIAKRFYGDPEKWAEIYDANRDVIRSPQSLSVGLKLKIP